MSSSNVIIPSCHYGLVFPPVRRTPSDLRPYENQTKLSPGTANRKKENTFIPEERETRDHFRKSLQINIRNVSFNRNAASFREIFHLPDGLN